MGLHWYFKPVFDHHIAFRKARHAGPGLDGGMEQHVAAFMDLRSIRCHRGHGAEHTGQRFNIHLNGIQRLA